MGQKRRGQPACPVAAWCQANHSHTQWIMREGRGCIMACAPSSPSLFEVATVCPKPSVGHGIFPPTQPCISVVTGCISGSLLLVTVTALGRFGHWDGSFGKKTVPAAPGLEIHLRGLGGGALSSMPRWGLLACSQHQGVKEP